MKKIFSFKDLGFTLIELLVVVSILGIIFGIGVSQYNQFNRRQIVEQAALTLKNNLRLAQNKAMAGEKPSDCSVLDGYQVSFLSGGENPDTYQIQAICEGVEVGDPLIFELPGVVKFSPPPPPILFKPLAHGTNLDGEMTINLKAFENDSYTKTIIITPSGEIR